MCDIVSWIEKDGKLYWSRDDEILATYGEVTEDHCGHSTLRKCQGITGGENYESAMQVPKEIAASVNRGELKLLSRAGGWVGLHFNEAGINDTPYWVRFKDELKKYESIPYTLDNHGAIDKKWIILESIDKSLDMPNVNSKSFFNACNQAWYQAYVQHKCQAWDHARDLCRNNDIDNSLVIAAPIIDGYETSKWYDYAKRRSSIIEAGYGFLGDIDGVFYVYKHL